MANQQTSQQSGRTSAQKQQNVVDSIRRKWTQLTDEEAHFYETSRQRLCNAIGQKYGVSQEEIDKQLKALERDSSMAA